MEKNYRPSVVSKGLTQRELFAKSDRRIVQDNVQDQIKLIDTSILTAHAAGFNHIEHELPTNFPINNLDKSDAQTMIYSEILMLYKNPESQGGKGFEKVYIDGGAKSILHIYWLNGMDENERARRKEFIYSCTIQPVPRKTTKNKFNI